MPDSNLPVLEVKAMQIFQDAVLLPDKKALLYNCYFGRLHAYRSNYGSTDTMLLEFSRSLKDIGEKAAFDNDAELFVPYLANGRMNTSRKPISTTRDSKAIGPNCLVARTSRMLPS